MRRQELDEFAELAKHAQRADEALLRIKEALGGDVFLDEPDTLDAYEMVDGEALATIRETLRENDDVRHGKR